MIDLFNLQGDEFCQSIELQHNSGFHQATSDALSYRTNLSQKGINFRWKSPTCTVGIRKFKDQLEIILS